MPPPPAELFASRVLLGPALRAQPDRRLVDLVRDGYDAAFEEIVRRYRRPLDRFAAGIVGGRAEDVTQDAFSKALLALRGSEAEIELRPWLYRIVRNTALNDLRDREPAAAQLSEALPGARSAAAEVESREELRDLMARLRALPEPQRAALVMRELEGLSHEEIAAALGVSGGAARQTIYRARAALREGFGLLVPLPVLRLLAEYGGDASRAGGALAAGAGASSAGGAALGGGALKLGMATVLIAGTVGAGVAIQRHPGHRDGPEAAEAAPLVPRERHGAAAAATSELSSGSSGSEDRRLPGGEGPSGSSDRERRGDGSPGASLGSATRGDPGSGPGPATDGGSHSGESSDLSGGDSHHSGSGGRGGGGDSGSGSGSRSGSGDRHGGSDSDDGGASRAGSGSDGTGSSSGSGSSGDGLSASGGDGSGSGTSGGGDVEPVPTAEPVPTESSSGDGGFSDGSGGDSSGSGSGGSGGGADSLGSSSGASDGSS
jgi:RNA polymerase sigma factor (sigma-70 family)